MSEEKPGRDKAAAHIAELRAELRRHYAVERLIRPEGTRSVSSEIFVVGAEKRP